MGILPLEFLAGENRKCFELNGRETVDILTPYHDIDVKKLIDIEFKKPSGEVLSAKLLCRLDTNSELSWYKSGGVMPHILEKLKTAQGAQSF